MSEIFFKSFSINPETSIFWVISPFLNSKKFLFFHQTQKEKTFIFSFSRFFATFSIFRPELKSQSEKRIIIFSSFLSKNKFFASKSASEALLQKSFLSKNLLEIFFIFSEIHLKFEEIGFQIKEFFQK
jgi:hypothetical protein